MNLQMQKRLSALREPDAAPIWVWYQWNGIKQPRPDLRMSGHLPPGTSGVRIECIIAPCRVLLSDFLLWHYVLNGGYLPNSLADQEAFDEEEDHYLVQAGTSHARNIPVMYQHFYPHHLRSKIIASWQRIFDLDWMADDITCTTEEKVIQGTLWELRLEDVRRVQHFVAR
jgi:hypothetical protein